MWSDTWNVSYIELRIWNTTVFVTTISSLYALFESLFMRKVLELDLICLRRRPCGSEHGKPAKMSCLALRGLKRWKSLECSSVLFQLIGITGSRGFQSLTSLFVLGRHGLSLIGKLLTLNVLGLSKLMFVSRILEPPKWVISKSTVS